MLEPREATSLPRGGAQREVWSHFKPALGAQQWRNRASAREGVEVALPRKQHDWSRAAAFAETLAPAKGAAERKAAST